MSTETIDADELRALRRVADCAREARARQRSYYATRTGLALYAAKNAEADLDRALADLDVLRDEASAALPKEAPHA